MLEPSRVQELGREPLLRYSEILEGLFHTGVILCEGDADCRFYQATLDASLSRSAHRPHDLLFTHCGGKARMPSVVRALRAVAVPVRVIADIDVLNDEGTLRALVDALEGEWASIESDWRLLDSQVRSMGSPPLLSTIREQIERVLDEADESRLTSELTKSIRDLTKSQGGWSLVRATGGIRAVPAGDATQAAERLLDSLANLGLFVVSVGELEDWARDVGGHGPGWSTEALERGVHQQSAGHSEFVLRVAESLGAHGQSG